MAKQVWRLWAILTASLIIGLLHFAYAQDLSPEQQPPQNDVPRSSKMILEPAS
jgi:hypothetical protein